MEIILVLSVAKWGGCITPWIHHKKIYINTLVENVGFQMYTFYLYNMINSLIPTRY